jgi:hypothetical protein
MARVVGYADLAGRIHTMARGSAHALSAGCARELSILCGIEINLTILVFPAPEARVYNAPALHNFRWPFHWVSEEGSDVCWSTFASPELRPAFGVAPESCFPSFF